MTKSYQTDQQARGFSDTPQKKDRRVIISDPYRERIINMHGFLSSAFSNVHFARVHLHSLGRAANSLGSIWIHIRTNTSPTRRLQRSALLWMPVREADDILGGSSSLAITRMHYQGDDCDDGTAVFFPGENVGSRLSVRMTINTGLGVEPATSIMLSSRRSPF